jgi:hypothetical protein
MMVLGLEASRDRLLFDAASYKLWKIEVPPSSSPQSVVDKLQIETKLTKAYGGPGKGEFLGR